MKQFLIISISIVSLMLIASCSKRDNELDECKTGLEVLSFLSENYPEFKDWIRVDSTLTPASLFIDIDKKQILFTNYGPNPSDTVRVSYQDEKGDGKHSIKKCKKEDIDNFCKVLAEAFNLTKEKDEGKSVDELCEQIGATTDYLDDIVKENKLEWYDKVLSLLYNTRVGDSQKHLWIGIRDHKLIIVRQDNFPTMFINEQKVVEVVKSKYGKLAEKDLLKVIIDSAIVTKETPKFIYHNYRKDRVYVDTFQYTKKDKFAKIVYDRNDKYKVLIWHEGNVIKPFLTTEDSIYKGLIPCQVKCDAISPAEDVVASNASTVINYLKWIPELTIGLICILMGLLAGYFITKRKTNNKRNNMNIDKQVNKHALNLIKIVRKVQKCSSDDEECDKLVKELKALCSDFDYANVDDIEAWLDKYNSTETDDNIPQPNLPIVTNVTNESEGSINPLWGGVNAKSTHLDLVSTFDKIFNTNYKKEYLDLQEQVANLKEELKKSKKESAAVTKIKSCKTEEELVDTLTELKPAVKIKTLNSVCKQPNTKENSIAAITDILGDIDKVYGKRYTEIFKDLYLKAKDWHDARGYLNISNKETLSSYLKLARQTYLSSRHNINDAVKVVEIFKPDEKNNTLYVQPLKNINETLSNIYRIFHDICKKEEYNFWDRQSLILLSISQCVVPLLRILIRDNRIEIHLNEILGTIKNDAMFIYLAKIFLNEAQRGGVSAERFRAESFAKLQRSIEEYNMQYAHMGQCTEISSNTLPQEYMAIFEKLISNIRNYEDVSIFADKMWHIFVKEFLQYAPKCDKTYILAQALNIAYHTADFLDHLKGGRSTEYCFNYAFLLNNFNPDITRCDEFEHNHYMKSTNYSNFMYELAEELGIEKLNILIDNYLIKP